MMERQSVLVVSLTPPISNWSGLLFKYSDSGNIGKRAESEDEGERVESIVLGKAMGDKVTVMRRRKQSNNEDGSDA
jgi:hypothetical protein